MHFSRLSSVFISTFSRHVNISRHVNTSTGRSFSSSAIVDASTRKRTTALKKQALSLEEALYLTKSVGVMTAKEEQQVIMCSPPFSRGRSPFLLENFFKTIEPDEEVRESIHEEVPVDTVEADGETFELMDASIPVGSVMVHRNIVKSFVPQWSKTFFVDGREWLCTADGRGTNREATAHVMIRRGMGKVTVNGHWDFFSHFPLYYNRLEALLALYITGMAGQFDVNIALKKGGMSGRAGATRLALGRALVKACPSCAAEMEEDMILQEDMRRRWPKMPGRYGARTQEKWRKR